MGRSTWFSSDFQKELPAQFSGAFFGDMYLKLPDLFSKCEMLVQELTESLQEACHTKQNSSSS